jgi:hypothetical protein
MIGEELLGHDGRDFNSDKVGAGLDQLVQLITVFLVVCAFANKDTAGRNPISMLIKTSGGREESWY